MKKVLPIVLILGVAFTAYFFLPPEVTEPARRMAFIFVVAACFWAFEVIALYATSLLVVLLEIFLLCRPGGVMNMSPTGYEVFLIPFGSPVIMLFFGGLVMAVALSKYHIDNLIACRLLRIFGSSPYLILVGFMAATAFLSLWMSNTATTAMMIAMVAPLLSQIDAKDPFRRGLVLSIPFAANIGGMGTPIGTPPNAIAIGMLANEGIHLGFVDWMKMAVPLVVILLFITSIILYFAFYPRAKRIDLRMESTASGGRPAFLTGGIFLGTVVLWLTSSWHNIPAELVALLAGGLFFISGVLDHEDLKHVDWDVLVLMWGGLALGKGLEMTGLTGWVVGQDFFSGKGFVLVAAFCTLAVFLTTFMSNTATANLLLPLAMAVPGEDHVLLAVTVALACSLSMALPISTPPNAIAFATQALRVKDMVITGSLIAVISLVIILLGYQMVITKAFNLQ